MAKTLFWASSHALLGKFRAAIRSILRRILASAADHQDVHIHGLLHTRSPLAPENKPLTLLIESARPTTSCRSPSCSLRKSRDMGYNQLWHFDVGLPSAGTENPMHS